ncbi:MAG: multiprotein bridging factor aMBF1 [Candidatus Altiarchaeota archaeon]
MQCEICGRIVLAANRVRLEGSIVTACDECSSYGKILGKAEGEQPKKKAKPVEKVEHAVGEFDAEDENELKEDYDSIIRKAREGRGLKQEELAKMINEPSSLIHRIESRRIEPSPIVGRKLEKRLNVRIYKKREDFQVKQTGKDAVDLTLGDVVVVRKGEEE